KVARVDVLRAEEAAKARLRSTELLMVALRSPVSCGERLDPATSRLPGVPRATLGPFAPLLGVTSRGPRAFAPCFVSAAAPCEASRPCLAIARSGPRRGPAIWAGPRRPLPGTTEGRAGAA